MHDVLRIFFSVFAIVIMLSMPVVHVIYALWIRKPLNEPKPNSVKTTYGEKP